MAETILIVCLSLGIIFLLLKYRRLRNLVRLQADRLRDLNTRVLDAHREVVRAHNRHFPAPLLDDPNLPAFLRRQAE